MNRSIQNISDFIYKSILKNKINIINQYQSSKNAIGYFYIDDVLPIDLVMDIHECFPAFEEMILKQSLREDKYIAVQMNNYNKLLELVIFAFQDEKIVSLIGEICNVSDLHPDKNLYAGGLSLMKNKQFLNPHLDNSHDKDREKWRVFNLLYYVNPNWDVNFGGNLELWPNGLDKPQITIASKFNRLVVMATHQASWHSVSPIVNKEFSRQCISNYYFSLAPLKNSDQFHVTTFRGRPGQFIVNNLLTIDSFLRASIRRFFKKGIVENKHVYKK